MRQFTYLRPATVGEAVKAHNENANSYFIGGGTNLIDLMKMGVEEPAHLVDIKRISFKQIEEREGGVRIGAGATNTAAASHALIRSRYPVLTQAIMAGASGQLRNMATVGGNLLQRTRCYYFYDPVYRECNKRHPGSGCAAMQGYNRIHAILGASSECIATNPSDMSVALLALDAIVQTEGTHGPRSIPIQEFHRLPGDTPQLDTNLSPGELITAVDLPALPYAKCSTYLKVRDRNSYAFALVSVAAILNLDGSGAIQRIHIALGGVAHKPWRAQRAERFLIGKKPEGTNIRDAAEAELADAKPCPDNAFKVELAKRSIVRAVSTVANMA